MFKSHLKICKTLCTENYSHAYIFSGESGVGKFTLSKSFARMILNNEKIMRIEGVDEFNHPDLFVFDGAISKSQVDDLILNSLSLPYEADKKIYILKNFEDISLEGQNAILKTLEEPPNYLIIILIVGDISKVLPTIISRSRVITINSIKRSDLIDFIISKGFKKDANLIANISSGSIKDATSFLSNPEILGRRRDIINNVLNILRGGMSESFKSISFFEEQRENIDFTLKVIELFLRDILVFSSTKSKEDILNIDYIYEIESLNMDSKSSVIALDALVELRKSLKMNVNFKIAMESMLVKLGELNDKGIRSSF